MFNWTRIGIIGLHPGSEINFRGLEMNSHYDLANIPNPDLKDIFQQVSMEMGIPPALVEKDFWVSFLLKYLYQDSPWKEQKTDPFLYSRTAFYELNAPEKITLADKIGGPAGIRFNMSQQVKMMVH